ncbi:hypothetical protein GCM10009104_16840 [Marinobacterium maritimum]|uniref:Uncharacterized protein n=1 Tax=Marinobacterium maritimum TaxID=500162 RepID=A0ABP3TBD8_9GAMM
MASDYACTNDRFRYKKVISNRYRLVGASGEFGISLSTARALVAERHSGATLEVG